MASSLRQAAHLKVSDARGLPRVLRVQWRIDQAAPGVNHTDNDAAVMAVADGRQLKQKWSKRTVGNPNDAHLHSINDSRPRSFLEQWCLVRTTHNRPDAVLEIVSPS